MHTLRQTAQPTSMLGSNIFSDRRFLMVEPGDLEDTPEKLKLTFADHLFMTRSLPEQQLIVSKLKEFINEGFLLWFVGNPTNKDEKSLFRTLLKVSSSMLLDISYDKIYDSAYRSCGIRADELFILDYFAINKLLYGDENRISHALLTVFQNPAWQLVKNTQRNCYSLDLSETTVAEIDKFIAYFIEDNQHRLPSSAIKKLDLTKSKINIKQLALLLLTYSDIEELNLTGIDDELYYYGLGLPLSLPHLKTLNASNTKLSIRYLLIRWLGCAPQLQSLILNECSFVVHSHGDRLWDNVKERITTLTRIHINNTNLLSEDFQQLIDRCPNLAELSLRQDMDFQKMVASFKPNSMLSLKKIDLAKNVLDENSLERIWQAAPHLEEVDLSDCLINIKNVLRHEMYIDPLLKLDLKKISLKGALVRETERTNSFSGITISNIRYSLIYRKYLREISLSPHRWEFSIESMTGKEKTYASLEVADLSGAKINKNNLKFFLKNTPQLKELYLSEEYFKCDFVSDIRKQYPHLMIINSNPLIVKEKDSYAACLGYKQLELSAASQQIKSLDNMSDVEDQKYADPQAISPTLLRNYPMSHASTTFFDNTKKFTLPFKRYFADIDPSDYRLSLWRPDLNSLREDRNLLQANQFDSYSLDENRKYAENKQYKCHRGVYTPAPQEDFTLLLPSLHAAEKLVQLQVVTAAGTLLSPDQYEIQHHDEAGFYQVILKTATTVTIHFDVAVPIQQSLPDDLLLLQKTYLQYQPSTTTPPRVDPVSWKEFATEVRHAKAGPCRHRVVAGYDELTTQKGYSEKDVRIVENNVHTYLEVKVKGRWERLDLGGVSAALQEEKINSTPLPDTKKEVKQEEEKVASVVNVDVLPSQPESEPSSISHEIETITPQAVLTRPEKTLLLATSDDDLSHFYAEQRKKSNTVFIAAHPEELSITGRDLDETGHIVPGSRLSRWLQEKSSGGTLYVDIRTWKAGEIAQLNDLLDGRIEKQGMPEDIKIVIIDHPKRSYYGPDFRRRVKTKATAPFAGELLPNAPASLTKEDTLVIDLFQSPFWQRHLSGMRQLKPISLSTSLSSSASDGYDNALSLPWQAGQLLTALQSDEHHRIKNIVFKNPPIQDPNFLSFMAELQGLKRFSWANKTYSIPDGIHFYQDTQYHWQDLAKHVSLHALAEVDRTQLHVLSDANILNFIQDPACGFDDRMHHLISCPSHFAQAKKQEKPIDVVLAPGLSRGALAEFITEAKRQQVQVRFFVPNPQSIPAHSPLHHLHLSASPVDSSLRAHVFGGRGNPEAQSGSPRLSASQPRDDGDQKIHWQIHKDGYGAARLLQQKYPHACYFDVSSLEPGELDRFAQIEEKARQELLTTGRLSMTAPLSAIIQKLMDPKAVVILEGKIPPALYEAITKLTLGHIEGKPFAGQLFILPPQEQRGLAEALTGKNLQTQALESKPTLATEERLFFQAKLDQANPPLCADDFKNLDDESSAKKIDAQRLQGVQAALKLRPWAMIEGPTGIGKSHFLEKILPQAYKTVNRIEEWLDPKNPSVLVIDEASFRSEFSDQGENFLERFKGLLNNPPGFLWKGQYHELTPNHQVVFAFNPASYGAGRQTTGFLTEQNLAVHFKPLTSAYVRARLVDPLLKEFALPSDPNISEPLIAMYDWFVQHYPDEVLITPRELKLMVNLIMNHAKQHQITEPSALTMLAKEIAYQVGRQVALDRPQLLQHFDKQVPVPPALFSHKRIPATYLNDQREAYVTTMNLLETMQSLKRAQSESKVAEPDMGLGGLILEGASGIGKTHFIKQLIVEWQAKSAQPIYRISPSTPFFEKEKILREAFAKDALVVAEEFNASLWPNKLLNNFLMGKEENGESAKNPGFFLLATQNPPSFSGRLEEDPALRRRLFKMKLDWPLYRNLDEELVKVKRVISDFIPTTKASFFSAFFAQTNNAVYYQSLLSATQNNLHQAIIALALFDDKNNLDFSRYVSSKSLDHLKSVLQETVLRVKTSHELAEMKEKIHTFVNTKKLHANDAIAFVQQMGSSDYEVKKKYINAHLSVIPRGF
jgi:hypothetical protein